ncbi:MAG: PEP-CTERM sorting domain-containing protein [Pseudomonadota bacterium]
MKRILTAAAFAILGAGSASAATFQGEFWDVSGVSGLDSALSVIDSRAADATFESTGIDYPNGSPDRLSSGSSLATFLGSDAASLSGLASTALTGSIFRFTGFLDLAAGLQTFSLSSDDGYRLTIGGTEVGVFSGLRPVRTDTFSVDPGAGFTAFELIFYENRGNTGVTFSVDGQIAQPSPVPLPATLPLLLGALGLGGLAARRKQRA